MTSTIVGTGVVSNIGTGTTILSGPNTYSGVTTITAGNITINNPTFGGGDITDNGGLTFNTGAASSTYGGNITGTGTLTLTANTVTLTGPTITYTGNTVLTAGTLSSIPRNPPHSPASSVGSAT